MSDDVHNPDEFFAIQPLKQDIPDPSGFDLSKDRYPPDHFTYLPDGVWHEGLTLRESAPVYGMTELCVICHGYGGWNLRLNAYGNPGEHFNAFCTHCNGWGWVKPGQNDCAPHDWEEISRPSGHRSGEHTDQCTKCGKLRTYDTSD